MYHRCIRSSFQLYLKIDVWANKGKQLQNFVKYSHEDGEKTVMLVYNVEVLLSIK